MAKVAFLGLGVMGYPMAAHLKGRGAFGIGDHQWLVFAGRGSQHRQSQEQVAGILSRID